MNESGKAMAPTARLEVEFYGEVAQQLRASPHDAERLNLRLTKYANELMRDLAIPASASVSLNLQATSLFEPRRQFRVLNDDQPLRQILDLKAGDADQVKALRRRIEGVICNNRERLVSAAQARELLYEWLPSEPTERDETFFYALLAEATRRGVSWNHVEDWLKKQPQPLDGRRSIEICFEEVAMMRAPPPVKVFLAPRLLRTAAEGWLAKLSRSVSARLEAELGIGGGEIVFEPLETSGEQDEADFQISINALVISAATTGSGAGNQTGPSDEEFDDAIFTVLRSNAGLLLTSTKVSSLLETLAESFPWLVNEARKRYDLFTLTAALRALLDEEISIRDLRGILECLTTINGIGSANYSRYIVFHPNTANFLPPLPDSRLCNPSVLSLAETARLGLKRRISHKFSASQPFDRESQDSIISGNPTMYVLLLDRDLEERFAICEEVPLNGEEVADLTDKIYWELRDWPAESPMVLLTTVEIRRLLRRAIEKEFPQLAVLSFQELSPELSIKPQARIM